MKCHSCNTPMVLDKQETGAGSRTQWHSCPLCRKVRLTSEPATNPKVGFETAHGRPRSAASPIATTQRKGASFFA